MLGSISRDFALYIYIYLLYEIIARNFTENRVATYASSRWERSKEYIRSFYFLRRNDGALRAEDKEGEETERETRRKREERVGKRAARFPVWLVIDARYLHRGLVRVYSDTVLFHCNYG